MAGGFPVGARWNCVQASPYSGVFPIASATADVQGAYTEIFSATARDATWMYVQLHNRGGSSALEINGVNIARGAAGSEVVLISSLVVQRQPIVSNQQGGGSDYLFPCVIPAGTRIAASVQSSIASSIAIQCNVMLFDDGFASIPGGGATDTYGFNSATTLGTQIDPGGTVGTKGSYAQITSSTTYDLAGFFMGIDGTMQAPTAVASAFTIDLAVGASGSEQIVLPDFPMVVTTTTNVRCLYPASSMFFPIPIPAGSRIAARAACSSNATPTRLFDMTVYGVRL